MGTLAITLLLVIFHSVGLIHLPNGMIDKLSILFGVEIVTLLGVIVRDLSRNKKRRSPQATAAVPCPFGVPDGALSIGRFSAAR
jgi:hypothetical protein